MNGIIPRQYIGFAAPGQFTILRFVGKGSVSFLECDPPAIDNCADTHPHVRYPSTMRWQFFRLGLMGGMLLAPSMGWTQQATTKQVTIQVVDQTGTPIPHAQIRLVPVPNPAPTKLETDEHGNLSLDLKVGSYALSVLEQGFKNWSESIYVAKPEGEVRARQLIPVVLAVGQVSGPIVVYPADSLVISGGAYHAPVALSLTDFRALPHITVTVHNGHTNADETYSGVPLATLLAWVNAPIGKDFHKDALTTYLIASGSDGYSVVLSLGEVDPSFHGGHVLVADARDGRPLAKTGPFQLIVSEDKRPARWVRNLNSIRLAGAH